MYTHTLTYSHTHTRTHARTHTHAQTSPIFRIEQHCLEREVNGECVCRSSMARHGVELSAVLHEQHAHRRLPALHAGLLPVVEEVGSTVVRLGEHAPAPLPTLEVRRRKEGISSLSLLPSLLLPSLPHSPPPSPLLPPFPPSLPLLPLLLPPSLPSLPLFSQSSC